MQILGKILLFILNFLINLLLIGIIVFLLLWLVFDMTPERVMIWFEQKTGQPDFLQKTLPISSKYQQRAHQNLYVQELNKKDDAQDGPVSQPYRYE